MNLTLPNPAHRSAKVGGIFDQIGQYLNLGLQGLSAYQQVTAAGAGGGSGAARGLAAITAKSAEILGALDQMVAAAQQNPAQAGAILQQAEQLAASLSNAQYFYQAKSGQDAQVLADAKTAAAAKVAAIRSAASGGTGTLVTTNSSGQLITVPANTAPATSAAGFDLKEILPYAALGVAILAVMKK